MTGRIFISSCLHFSGLLSGTIFVCLNNLSYSVHLGTMEEQHKIYLFHLRTGLTFDLKSVHQERQNFKAPTITYTQYE
jgi:hypothetical protein